MSVSVIRLSSALLFSLACVATHAQHAAHKEKGPNGGQLREMGSYHVELVMKEPGKQPADTDLVLYLSDAKEKKVPTQGVNGKATIMSGKSKTTVDLTPDGDNRLKGKAKVSEDHEMRVLVSLTLPDKKAQQVRFTPFGAKDHKH